MESNNFARLQHEDFFSSILQTLIQEKNFQALTTPCQPQDLLTFTLAVQEYFAKIFGERKVKQNFEIPQEYQHFLGLGTRLFQKSGQDIWHSVEDWRGVLQLTLEPWLSYALDDLRVRAQNQQFAKNDTFWLTIGYWGDKHEYHLCCDKSHPRYGKVFDYHDASPYDGEYDGYVPGFIDFLQALAAKESTLWRYDYFD